MTEKRITIFATRARADRAKMAVDIARTAGNGRVYPGAHLRKLVR